MRKSTENCGGGDSTTLLKVKKNIEMCCRAISSHKGNWAITTTITHASTKKDIHAIEKFAKEHGFMYAIRPYIFVKGVAGKRDENLEYTSESKKYVLDIFYHMYKKAKKENYLASIIYREHIKYIKNEKLPQCDAMRYSMVMKETGEIFPCLELPDCEFDFNTFHTANKKYKKIICQCSEQTPCYWNCARTVGALIRNKWKIAFHIIEIITQMRKYGNYF